MFLDNGLIYGQGAILQPTILIVFFTKHIANHIDLLHVEREMYL